MHRRVWEFYSREQTQGEILRLKNVRVKTSLASGVTVVSRRTCRTFRTFDMFWIDFRTRRMKRAGACWTRERDSARFADGNIFASRRVCRERVLRSRIPRVLSSVLSLPLTRVRSGLFSQQRRTVTKRVCVHPFTISADNTFSFSLNRVSISKLAAATKRRSALRKSPKTSTWRCW